MGNPVFRYCFATGVCGGYTLSPPLLKRLGPTKTLIMGLIYGEEWDLWDGRLLKRLVSSIGVSPELFRDHLVELVEYGILEQSNRGNQLIVQSSKDIDEVLERRFPGLKMEICQAFMDSIAGFTKGDSRAFYSEIQSFAGEMSLTDKELGLLGIDASLPDSNLKPAKPKTGYVYLLNAVGTNRYKIGVTKDMERRATTLTKQSPFPIDVIAVYCDRDIYCEESKWHERFAESRAHGEWFELGESQIIEFKLFADSKSQMEEADAVV